MDRWDEGWAESVKRQVVSDAFYIHQHKGTISAIRRVVEPFGFLIRVIEWWKNGEAPERSAWTSACSRALLKKPIRSLSG